MIGTFFETAEDRAVNHAYEVLKGNTPDGLLPTTRQQAILRIIADKRGLKNAILVGRLAELLKATPRQIKDDIRDLRLLFKVRIGSSRDAIDGGVYLITTKEEALDTARPFLRQASAELAVARAILEPHELAELEGQLRLEAAPNA
ncbi:MAG TPA: hypothetical protein VGN16_21010 [Acidobacteriaceae bacterium]|jgi:hypothetical protein